MLRPEPVSTTESAPGGMATARAWAYASVILLAILAAAATLGRTRSLFLPVAAAILLYFTLAPLVRGLLKVRLPRPVGAAVVLTAGIALLAAFVMFLSEPAMEWLRDLPTSAAQIQRQLGSYLEPVQEVQEATLEATRQVQSITDVDDENAPEVVRIEEPGRMETLLADTGALLTSSLIAAVLLYFLLATDGSFLRRAVQTIPNLAEKDLATGFLRRFESEISHYLLTISLINGALGLAVAAALWWVGVPYPLLWGLLAGFLNFVPYLGAALGVLLVGLAALGEVEPVGRALLAPAAYLSLTALEGTLITPAVIGRRMRLSPVAIFLWLLLWNWIWGMPGALVAVPLLVTVKVFCDNTPSLEKVGRLLGRE